jgi:hypothetical protein
MEIRVRKQELAYTEESSHFLFTPVFIYIAPATQTHKSIRNPREPQTRKEEERLTQTKGGFCR